MTDHEVGNDDSGVPDKTVKVIKVAFMIAVFIGAVIIMAHAFSVLCNGDCYD